MRDLGRCNNGKLGYFDTIISKHVNKEGGKRARQLRINDIKNMESLTKGIKTLLGDRLITWFSTRSNPLTACWPGPGIRVFKFDGRLGFKSTFEVAMKLN
ncbi:hypothetical protein Tco_1324065, partial [Tanacetum coccineum]